MFSFVVVFTFSMLFLCSRIAIQFSFVRSVSLQSLHFIYFVKDGELFPIKMNKKKYVQYWRRPNPSLLPFQNAILSTQTICRIHYMHAHTHIHTQTRHTSPRTQPTTAAIHPIRRFGRFAECCWTIWIRNIGWHRTNKYTKSNRRPLPLLLLHVY